MSDIQLFRLSNELPSQLDPAWVTREDGFSRDVSEVGHWGTGDIELTLRMQADLERAKPLLERSYTEG